MKILLVSANRQKVPYPVYPLGLDQVAGALSPHHQVKILDLAAQPSAPGWLEMVRGFDPDVVGISLRNIDSTDGAQPLSFIDGYKELVQTIREVSSAPVVLGGAGYTIFPRECLLELGADFGVAGEGERLNLLLDAMETDQCTRGIPGIVVPSVETVRPEPWPGKVRRIVPTREEHIHHYVRTGGILNLQSKRGCPFHCIYCTYPQIEGSTLRRFDPAQVGNEAKQLQKAGAKFLFFTDAVFNSDPEFSLRVAQAMKDFQVSIPWGAFFSPSQPAQGYYRELARAGLTHVEFGTDSLSEKMLQNYQKPFGMSEVLSAHEAAISAGLFVAHYFLLGGPGEDAQTVGETLSLAEQLPNSVLFFFCGMRIYPGTKLYEMAAADGQILSDESLLRPRFYQSRHLDSQGLLQRVERQAKGRLNWVIGAGGERFSRLTERMYQKGHVGPLWEKLIH